MLFEQQMGLPLAESSNNPDPGHDLQPWVGVSLHKAFSRKSTDRRWSAQEAVLRFVLDAVRAETFNDARTLFLFGSYTIGKERLFLEVARQLGKKVRDSRRTLATAPCSIMSAPQPGHTANRGRHRHEYGLPPLLEVPAWPCSPTPKPWYPGARSSYSSLLAMLSCNADCGPLAGSRCT